MKSIQLIFKKLGNHWYLNIPHENPQDLVLDRGFELFLERLDTWKDGIVNSVWIHEQTGFIDSEGLIQFDNEDITRYFTTDDVFTMSIYISGHKFTISSRLYFLLEQTYKLDLHELVYKINIF